MAAALRSRGPPVTWRWTVLLALALAALWPGRASACRTCAGPVLTDARGTPDGLLPGELALVMNLGGAWLEGGPVGGDGARAPDADTAFVEARPVLTLGFSHAWSLEVQVPLRYALTLDEVGPDSGSALGFGDPAISARLAMPVSAWTLVGSVGATLPLGRWSAVDANGEVVTALGSGTVNPIASLELTRHFGEVWMRASVLAFVPAYANGDGVRAGGRVQGSVFAEVPVSRRWLLGGGVDVVQELPGRPPDGVTPENARTRALVGASARMWLGAWSARLTVKAAPWERGDGRRASTAGGSAMPLSGNLAFETRFDVGT